MLRKMIFLIALVFLGIPAFSEAYMYPNDLKTDYYFSNSTDTVVTLFTVPTGQTWTLLNTYIADSSIGCTASSVFLRYNSNTDVTKIFSYLSSVNTIRFVNWTGSIKFNSGEKLYLNKGASCSTNASFSYVPYDLTIVPLDLAGTEARLTSIDARLNNEGANIVTLKQEMHEVRSWIVVGIYFFFTIMFISFIYKWFFGRF